MTERELKLLAMAQDERSNENERFTAFKQLCKTGALTTIVENERMSKEIIRLEEERAERIREYFKAHEEYKASPKGRREEEILNNLSEMQNELERLRRKTMPIAERDAEILKLHNVQGWSMQRIGDWFSMSKGNVHRIITRAAK